MLRFKNASFPLLRYLVAIIATMIALALSLLFLPVIQNTRLIFFVGALVFSAWYGGLGPGLLSTILSILLADYFAMEPFYQFNFHIADALQLSIFSVVAFFISWIEETRLQSEKALSEAKELMEVILSNIGDGVTAQNADGAVVFANDTAAHSSGFDSAKTMMEAPLTGLQRRFQVINEDGEVIPFSELPHRKALAQGVSGRMVYRIRDLDKGVEQWMILRSTPVFDGQRKVRMVVNTFRDVSERKQIEITLRNQRERLRITLASMGDGFIATDTDGIIEVMNPAAATMTGWDAGEAIGRRFDEVFRIIGDDDQQNAENPIENVLRQKIRVDTTNYNRLFHKEGKGIPIQYSIAPVIKENGEIIGTVTVFRDESERHQIEQIQHESEQHLRDVIDNLSIFVGVLTPFGMITEVNATTLKSFNLKAKDILGRLLEETYPMSYSQKVQSQLQDSIARASQGEIVRYDLSVRVAEDQYMTVDFMLSPVYDAEGKVTYLIGSGVDITERKRIENDRTRVTFLLEAYRQRLNNILENIPGIVWEASGAPDNNQKIEFVSRYAEKILGYSVDEWVSSPDIWSVIIHPDDLLTMISQSTALYETAASGVMQFNCVTKDVRTIPVEMHSTVILDHAEKPVGMRGVIMDISERKQTEQALAQYALDLRRSNEELRQFAYVASHDLQEPLRMVTSYLQLIEERYSDKLGEDAREFIAYAVDGATRMKALIKDLLIYSRVETSQKSFAKVNTQLPLDQALIYLQMAIDESQAIITNDPMPEIIADEGQLIQLFQNLIGNALKFRSEKPPEIHIGVLKRKNEWLFSVSDNGIGIESQYLDRIFVIFQRLHSKDKYPGTGIGLAICKKVIEHHGGRIWAESEVGKGTTFYLTISELAENKKSGVYEGNRNFNGRRQPG